MHQYHHKGNTDLLQAQLVDHCFSCLTLVTSIVKLQLRKHISYAGVSHDFQQKHHEITSIMLFMQRLALLILISPVLYYLPHGSSEGWNSEIICLSIMWLNSLSTANFTGFLLVHLKAIAHSLSFIQNGSIRYVTKMYLFIQKATAPLSVSQPR